MRFSVSVAAVLAMFAVLAGPAAGATVKNVNRGETPAGIRSYWTPERMAQAMEMSSEGPVFTPAGSDATSPALASALRHQPARNAPSAIGKLYLRWLGYRATCSGAVINTPSQRLVLTAGHCLKYLGVWSDHLMFVPAYDYGRRPFGSYSWKTAWITGPWARNSSGKFDNYDMGIIVTRRTWNGKRIGNMVGSLDYRAFPRRSGRTKILGYPAGSNRAREVRKCTVGTWAGPFYSFRLPGPVGKTARCNMAPGSSGGPWMTAYPDGFGGTDWLVDGVTSTGFRRQLATPYFGSHFRQLVYNAENR